MGFLLPTTRTSVQTGQTSEFAITSSRFGQEIPRLVQGTDRLSGNVIWADDIEERTTEEVMRSGGKGAPRVETTTTTFEYYVSLAVMLTEGPVDGHGRIWADGKLIYDDTFTPEAINFATIISRLDVPNPGALPLAGVSLGTFSGEIIFDSISLARVWMQPGGPLSNIFEVDLASGTVQSRLDTLVSGGTRGGLEGVTQSGNLIIQPVETSNGRNLEVRSRSFGLIRRVNINRRWRGAVHPNGAGANQVFMVRNIFDAVVGPAGFTMVDVDASPDSSAVFSPSLNPGPLGVFVTIDVPTGASTTNVVNGGPLTAFGFIVQADRLRLIQGSTAVTLTELGNVTAGQLTGDPLSEFTSLDTFLVGFDGVVGGLICSVEVDNRNFVIRVSTGGSLIWVTEVPFRPRGLGQTVGPRLAGSWLYSNDERIIEIDSVDGSIDPIYNGQIDITLLDEIPGSAAIVDTIWDGLSRTMWRTVVGGNPSPGYRIYRLQESGDGVSEVSGLNFRFYPGDEEQLPDPLIESFIGENLTPAFRGRSYIVFENLPLINFGNRIPGITVEVFNGARNADVSPQVAVAEVCQLVGLMPGEDIDTSRLPLVVPGLRSLLLSERTSASAALEPLFDLLQVDTIESDYQVRFIPRGSNIVSERISEDEFIATEDNEGQVYVIADVEEIQLPRRFEVEYTDFDNAFQSGLQADERADSTQFSLRPLGFTYNGAATANLARQSAQINLYTAWAERQRLGTRLPPRYILLDPADIVETLIDDGRNISGRLRVADHGADFTTDINQVVEGVDQFSSTIQGFGGDNNLQTSIPNTGDSDVFLLDTPLLRDEDSGGQENTITYWAANGDPRWLGAVLYRQVGGSSVIDLGRQIRPAAHGVVSTPPPDAETVTRFEESSMVLSVFRGIDQFESVADADVLAGANLVALIRDDGEVELIQFANAEVIDDGQIRLSRLLRGRRGTEPFAELHEAGQTFVLMSSTITNAFGSSIGTLNAVQSYRGVTVGQLFENAESQDFTDTGRDLRPYSPVQLEAEDDTAGGVTLSWVRRTRIGGALMDNIEVPLSEAVEQYEVEIRATSDGPLLRTLTGITTPSVLYSAADVIADFGGVPANIHMTVFQVSAVVGRGFPGAGQINVQVP